MPAKIVKSGFGRMPDGQDVALFTLTNAHGCEARIIEYGGITTSLKLPDHTGGRLDDVVLGYDTLEGYLEDTGYLGALVGRYGNRIAKGKFSLGGKDYTLAANNGPNHLHGGVQSFSHVVWRGEPVEHSGNRWLRLHYTSADGEEGYPGTLTVAVDVTLTDENELAFVYRAETDAPTHVNLTHHGYFNLGGAGSGDVRGHELWLAADHYLPTDEGLIPLPGMADVAGTPFDFRTARRIGERLEADDPQIRLAKGYDHNWVLNRSHAGALMVAARVSDPKSKRVMEVWTREPGIQFYTGNHLPGAPGKNGHLLEPYTGFCLETQHYPDTPNRPDFPSTVLRPGEVYQTETRYRFLIGR